MTKLATNKYALFNYDLLEQMEAGIVLRGWEVKSIKAGWASLKESYITVKTGKVILVGCHVPRWPGAQIVSEQEDEDRELLLHKSEVNKLLGSIKIQGNTIIPLNFHLSRGKVKIDIALAKGKKKYDKRAKLKELDQKRAIERDLKHMGY
jgi:SsrA-binding protein